MPVAAAQAGRAGRRPRADTPTAAGLPREAGRQRQRTPGWKFAEWEMKGVPAAPGGRVPSDIENGQCVLVRRDTREKQFVEAGRAGDRHPRCHWRPWQRTCTTAPMQNRENRTYGCHHHGRGQGAVPRRTPASSRPCGAATWPVSEAMKEDAGLSSRCMPFAQEHLSDVCPVLRQARPEDGRLGRSVRRRHRADSRA